MLNPETLVTTDRTLCGVVGTSKKRCLEMAAEQLAAAIPGCEALEVFESLLGRERLGSTAFGNGIALPHGRLPNATTIVGTLIKLAEPIEFDAIDGEPVDIIFGLAVPQEANDDHVRTLAFLAELFEQPEVLEQLREANTSELLHQTFIDIAKS
jgi:PTS system nitrogen regulatory IIA component|tara:strand:- start:1377 stop:1838 length:462 start_codon:yes stop_codon:yes gene_type:complete